MFLTYAMAPNSDYFPVVDQRASKTRFTQVRVSELVDLQAAVVPMLAMIDGREAPSRARPEGVPTTFVDAASTEAWVLHDLVMGQGAPAPLGPEVNAREASARLVRAWASNCPKDLGPEHARQAMVTVAEIVNAHLNRDAAAKLWRSIAESPCAKAAPAVERRWLELFEAVALRDAARMAAVGMAALEGAPAQKNSATEYAFFSAMTGLVCGGDRAKARAFLEEGVWKWVRPGTRRSEIRFLDALTDPKASDARRCAAR
jgi:hypothetical protein